MSTALLAGLGIVVGFLAGLLGIGGGILLVPALLAYGHYFYAGEIGEDVLMHIALGTSLAIIIPTGISSALAQIRRKAVDWNCVKKLTPGLMVGVVGGVVLAASLKGATLQIIFAVGMYLIAFLIGKKPSPNHIRPGLLSWPVVIPATSLIGSFATLLGLGGSIINIPYMTYAGIPLHRAIATGSVMGIIVALPAATGFVVTGMAEAALPAEFLGFINMKAWLCIVPFSILTAPLGVKVSHKTDVKKLRLFFSVFILIVASKMLLDVISSYF